MADAHTTPRIVGHRGLPLEFPDNTLSGIVASAQVCAMTEIDVRLSRDRRLVLGHDPDVAGMVISENDWDVLREVDVGDGHSPALLSEVVEAVGDYPLNLEIKALPGQPGFEDASTLAAAVAAVARPFDLVTCFYWPVVDQVRSARPDVSTGLLIEPGGSLEGAIEWAGAKGHHAVAPHWSLAVDADVAAIHDLDLEVTVWTVDDPDGARLLASKGIDAIITNDPRSIALAIHGDAQ